MGLLNRQSGNTHKDTAQNRLAWEPLTDLQQLDGIGADSIETPALIFKHSTRCGISNMVLKNFERYYDIPHEELSTYFLDLLAHRDISNEIALRFAVPHESPQVLIVRDGKCVYTASHGDIDADFIKEKIRP